MSDPTAPMHPDWEISKARIEQAQLAAQAAQIKPDFKAVAIKAFKAAGFEVEE